MEKPYRGRFAPSPTGPLHFGSLVAALGSYLDAKANGGQWLLRMEDLDTPRNVAGAAQQIMRQLEACALYWDGAVTWQSQRVDLYQQALDRLKQAGRVYPCGCSRKEIADSSLSGIEGPVYPGTCRSGLPPGRQTRAWRVRVDAAPVAFEDARAGHLEQDLAHDVGDFVLLRADGIFAYQLAVVVDDAEQGITHVVRGADLLLSTPRQIYLQRLLALPTPRYRHLPVALSAQGEKLSKQTHAPAIEIAQAGAALCRALDFLGHRPPQALHAASSAHVIAWALEAYRAAR